MYPHLDDWLSMQTAANPSEKEHPLSYSSGMTTSPFLLMNPTLLCSETRANPRIAPFDCKSVEECSFLVCQSVPIIHRDILVHILAQTSERLRI